MFGGIRSNYTAYPNIVRWCVSAGGEISQPDSQMYSPDMSLDIPLRGLVPTQGSVIDGAGASISAILEVF